VSGTSRSTELSHYDTACRALADAKDLSEVKDIADKAVAIKEYARRAKDRDMEVNAAELRIRAERRLGEMLIEIKQATGLSSGQLRRGSKSEPRDEKPRLDDIGIDKKLSSRAQKLAVFDESSFGERLDAWRDRAIGEGSRVSVDMLRESEQSERRAAHAAKTFSGGTVDDLHTLIASGFRAAAILADPPWKFISRSERGEGRSANQHYRNGGASCGERAPGRTGIRHRDSRDPISKSMGADTKLARARKLIADGIGERAVARETGLAYHL
jgi:hypothetical protein